MNKRLGLIFIVILLAGGGTLAFLSGKQSDSKPAVSTSESKPSTQSQPDENKKSDDKGTYLTLADYQANAGQYAGSKKIYFFHASWCPICRSIDKEINDDPSKLPAGVTLIKTDFDTATELRKKYGVTTQYSFVHFADNGDEVSMWSATSLSDLLIKIPS